MVKGLYTAYTGMLNEQNRMDIMTNNLANADTNGYKKEGSTAQTFADTYAIKIKDTSAYNLSLIHIYQEPKRWTSDIHQCKGQLTCNIGRNIDEIRKDNGK